MRLGLGYPGKDMEKQGGTEVLQRIVSFLILRRDPLGKEKMASWWV